LQAHEVAAGNGVPLSASDLGARAQPFEAFAAFVLDSSVPRVAEPEPQRHQIADSVVLRAHSEFAHLATAGQPGIGLGFPIT